MLDERMESADDPVDLSSGLFGLRPGVLPARSGRVVRSMSVSMVTSVLSLSLLAVLVYQSSMSPAWANVVASLAAVGPSFALNRRYAWRCTGRGHVRRELLPFWVYALCSLAACTAAVDLAGHWAATSGVAPATRTAVVLGANIAMSMVLWCGQFTLLERTLLPRRAEA
ncbi:MAG TPA: GtrA family protein [Ilumatobacteraceae bacterium]|nr:GtrA family protein [Ilumatobacteraceae bacterium]